MQNNQHLTKTRVELEENSIFYYEVSVADIMLKPLYTPIIYC